MKNSKLMTLLKGIIYENPVLILVLGTCPTLATTKSIFQAVSMGLAATAVLICSNLVISLLRKVIPDVVRIPCYIVVIAAFVTAVSMLLEAYVEPVYTVLGPWLALIVVNCIVLGRAEMFARKNTVIDSALDGLGMGIGFLIALLCMAIIREVFGVGSFAGIEIPFLVNYKIPLLAQAPGGFLVFGILIAIVNKISAKKGKKKEYSCDGCPCASICGKVTCSEMIEVASEAADNAQAGAAAEVARKEDSKE